MEALVSAAVRPGPAIHRSADRGPSLARRAAAQNAGKAPANLTRAMAACGDPHVPAASAFQSAL